VLCCAEIKGAFALADAYCAGRSADALGRNGSDGAIGAAVLAARRPSPLEGLNARTYGPGPEADVEFCAQVDVLQTVPRMVGTAAEIVA
jgi:phosphosulfolactate phosphohydrolase-like enzyme